VIVGLRDLPIADGDIHLERHSRCEVGLVPSDVLQRPLLLSVGLLNTVRLPALRLALVGLLLLLLFGVGRVLVAEVGLLAVVDALVKKENRVLEASGSEKSGEYCSESSSRETSLFLVASSYSFAFDKLLPSPLG
jgi:hypothetical protein